MQGDRSVERSIEAATWIFVRWKIHWCTFRKRKRVCFNESNFQDRVLSPKTTLTAFPTLSGRSFCKRKWVSLFLCYAFTTVHHETHIFKSIVKDIVYLRNTILMKTLCSLFACDQCPSHICTGQNNIWYTVAP